MRRQPKPDKLTEPSSPDQLKDLNDRLEAVKSKHAEPEGSDADNSLLAMGWRISTELVVAVVLGTIVGYGIDYLLGTKPWITILGLVIGTAAGIRNTFRLVLEMEKAEKAKLEARQ